MRIPNNFCRLWCTTLALTINSFITCQAQDAQVTDKLPYLVAILDKADHQFISAGTIIDKQWILTSASPLSQLDPDRILVAVGDFNCFDIQSDNQLVGIEDYWYGAGHKTPMAAYNSALIKLAEPLEFNQEVRLLNLMDTQFKQMEVMSSYLYPSDEMLQAFQKAIEPTNQYVAGFDIYGDKTLIEVKEDSYAFDDNYPVLSNEDEFEAADNWFASWAQDLQWSVDEDTNEAAKGTVDQNADSPDPVAQPFFKPISPADNILTHGFTGGPLVSKSNENGLQAVSGVATWWTLNALPEGMLSTTLQGDPESVWAIKRWYDYTPLMSSFIQEVTARKNNKGIVDYLTGLGNNPPSLMLTEDMQVPWEALGGKGYGDLEFQAKEVQSWQQLGELSEQMKLKSSGQIKLKPGFWIRSQRSAIDLMAVDAPISQPGRFSAVIEPEVAPRNYLGAVLGTAGSDFFSPTATFLLMSLFKDAWMPFVDDQSSPPDAVDPNEFPPTSQLMDFTGSNGAPSIYATSQGSNAGGGGDGGDDGNGSTGGGDGGGSSGSGGSGGNGDDDGDDEKKDDVKVDPNDEEELILAFLHLMQIINWEFVNANGGMQLADDADPRTILNRIPACNQQYILGLIVTFRDRYGPVWVRHYINEEGTPYNTRQFLWLVIREIDRLAEEVIDARDRDLVGNPNLPITEQARFDDQTLVLLRPFYGNPVGPLLGGQHFADALDALQHNQFQGFNTNGANGLHIRVIENLINWTVDGQAAPGVEQFTRFDRNNPDHGIPPLLRRLLRHADYLVFDNQFDRRRHPIDQIRQIWNHFRNTDQQEPSDDERYFFNWLPHDPNDDDPIQPVPPPQNQQGVPDRCPPLEAPWLQFGGDDCDYDPDNLDQLTIDLGNLISLLDIKPKSRNRTQINALVSQLGNLISQWKNLVPEQDRENPQAQSWDNAYLEVVTSDSQGTVFEVLAEIVVIYAHFREKTFNLYHFSPDRIELIGIENYQFLINLIEWLISSDYISELAQLFLDGTLSDSGYYDTNRFPWGNLINDFRTLIKQDLEATLLEYQYIDAGILERFVNWQSYMYNRLQLNLSVKESLIKWDPDNDKEAYENIVQWGPVRSNDWQILQQLIIGSGRKCIRINFDAGLIDPAHRPYLEEIIEAIRADYRRVGHWHTEWRDVADPYQAFYNGYTLLTNLDDSFLNPNNINVHHFLKLEWETRRSFIWYEFALENFIKYDRMYFSSAIKNNVFDPLGEIGYIKGEIDRARSLREIPYGLNLDLRMFANQFRETLENIINSPMYSGSAGPTYEYMFDPDDLLKVFRVLFWMRNNSLTNRDRIPVVATIPQNDPDSYFLGAVLEFVEWMFKEYIPANMDPNTFEPTGRYQGIRFDSEPINLSLYIELRYISLQRLSQVVGDIDNFNSRYHQNGHNVPDALGPCLTQYFKRLFSYSRRAQLRIKFIADRYYLYGMTDEVLQAMKIIVYYFENLDVGRGLSNPPEALFEFHRHPTRDELLGDETVNCLKEEEDEKNDDDDQADQRLAQDQPDEKKERQQEILYPNPSNGNLNLSGDWGQWNHCQFSIIDQSGVLLEVFDLETFESDPQKLSLRFDHLKDGIYIMNMDCNGKAESYKFVIKR